METTPSDNQDLHDRCPATTNRSTSGRGEKNNSSHSGSNESAKRIGAGRQQQSSSSRGRGGHRGRGGARQNRTSHNRGGNGTIEPDTKQTAVERLQPAGRDGKFNGRRPGRGNGQRGRANTIPSSRGGRSAVDGRGHGSRQSLSKDTSNDDAPLTNHAQLALSDISKQNAAATTKIMTQDDDTKSHKSQQHQDKLSYKAERSNNDRSSKRIERKKEMDDKKSQRNMNANRNITKEQRDRNPKVHVTNNATFAPTVPPNQSQQTSDLTYGKGETITILHIAEKPSIAQAIAKGLLDRGNNSNNNNNNDTGGRKKSLPVYEFTSSQPFPKAPYASQCYHKVTSVAGHVFSVDFPPQYQSWESVDPAELFVAPVVRTPCKGSVVKHLQDEARNVHFIVLWMDCDREGENINFEVLDCCMHLMKSGGGGHSMTTNYDRVYRAYFSAINPSDIQKAYQVLGKPDKNQALAVDARQELDLKVGVAFSRFQTRFFQGRYGDLDSAVLSYGPCQTPTLGFCVQRHIDIETFKPEPYWILELNVLKRGRKLKAVWSSGRSFNKNRVEQLLTRALESEPIVTVSDVVIKEKKQGRPIPLNTVALLKACSKALGIGPHAAMQTAERLYLSGYLSYPRTESTTYPASFDIVGTLKEQADDHRWGVYVRELLQAGRNTTSRGGVDMGDHPPITPCRSARSNELLGDMARIYELVVRHFIASVSPDAVWRSTRVTFNVSALGEKGVFVLSGKELVSAGFLAVLLHKEYGNETNDGFADEEGNEEEMTIPDFTTGEVIPILNTKSNSSSKVIMTPSESVWASVEIKERVTTPPTYLTEAELIGMMEKHGIGTDASIATHIENVQKRNYVAIASGRRLVPSKLGLVLAQGYHQIDSSLVLPQVRSDIESQCNKIAQGQASKDAVVRAAIDLFRSKYDVFVKCIDRMDVLFGSSFLKLEEVGKPFTRCGLTRRYLTYIPGPPPRLYNKWTESVYPLPLGGIVKQWTGKHCSVDNCNFELCLYSVGQPQRTFPLCPRCFNDVNFALDPSNLSSDSIDRVDQGKEIEIRKMAGKSLVLECPLPDHHPSIEELTVSPHPSGGVLLLDPHFGPKWRLVSTRDPTIVHLPQSVEKVSVLDKKDDVLQFRMMQVEFKANESPLPNGKNKLVCCFANDETMQGMVRVHYGSDRLKSTGRGRGRGHGRGRGDGRSGRTTGKGRH
jgi:DNA topoisomerase III